MTFFWKIMVDMFSKGIISTFKDWNCGRFKRYIAAIFASNSRLMDIMVKERTQIPVYQLCEVYNQVFSSLWVAFILFPEFLHILITFNVTDSFPLLVFRIKSVRMNCVYSSFQEIISGVPQGFVLDPILLTLFFIAIIMKYPVSIYRESFSN